MKFFLSGSFLFVFALILTCSVMEISLRCLRIPPYQVKPLPAMFTHDDNLGFVLRKNSEFIYSDIDFSVLIHSNSYGIRDGEYKKQSVKTAALVVGDSFAFGHGVNIDEAFASLLEFELKKDVIKAGMESYSPRQALIMMGKMLKRFRPDLVIFTFYEGNDWGDDLYVRPFHDVRGGYLIRPSDKRSAEDIVNQAVESANKKNTSFLVTDSNFLNASKFYRWIKYRMLLGGLIDNPFLKRNFDGSYNCPLPIYTDYIRTGFPYIGESGAEQWKLVTNVFIEASILAEHNGANLLVVIIPDKVQACERLRKRLALECSNLKDFSNPEVFDFESAGKKLSEFLRQNGIECVNMLPYFKKNQHSERLYFPFDPHLSPAGHRVVADIIGRKLSAMRK